MEDQWGLELKLRPFRGLIIYVLRILLVRDRKQFWNVLLLLNVFLGVSYLLNINTLSGILILLCLFTFLRYLCTEKLHYLNSLTGNQDAESDIQMYHSLLSRLNVIQKTIVDVLRDVLAYRRHNSTKFTIHVCSILLLCAYFAAQLSSFQLLFVTVNGFLLIPAAIQFNFFPSFLEKLKPMLVHLETFIKNKWNVSE